MKLLDTRLLLCRKLLPKYTVYAHRIKESLWTLSSSISNIIYISFNLTTFIISLPSVHCIFTCSLHLLIFIFIDLLFRRSFVCFGAPDFSMFYNASSANPPSLLHFYLFLSFHRKYSLFFCISAIINIILCL